MRYWLLTSTTYGTWLPGDPRGSVTSVRDYRPTDSPTTSRVEHDRPEEPWEPSLPELYESARLQMKGPPVFLTREHAPVLLTQFCETATYRQWTLLAASIMANHFHLVLAVADDPEPRKMLADLKAYGSRALNRCCGKPRSGRWWTSGGSKRKLPDERAVRAAIYYVLHKQPHPLMTWSPESTD